MDLAERARLWSITVTFIIFASCFKESGSLSNDILGLDIPDPSLDSNTVCRTYPDLTASQYSLCVKYPEVMAAAIQGIQLAIHECQFQFREHRWNCSSMETKNRNPHSSRLLQKGFKETAFAYAISAAGMSAQISRACALGKLAPCGCSPLMDRATGQWVWNGCEHNVDFGDYFTRKFWDSKERAKDLQSQMNIHNNRAGRMIWRNSVKLQCKCHGMSGSCEMKTCWKAASSFRHVGSIIKRKFNHAKKVDGDNSSNRKRRFKALRRRKRQIQKTELVYYENSPNFCEPDWTVDSPGTEGRICNATTTRINNCDTLCCGRGYNTLRMSRNERCQCKFHWCCYVACKTCTRTEWVTVCK